MLFPAHTPSAAFLVESPLQALSATEARDAYGCDPGAAVAVVGSATGAEGATQVATVLARGGWRTVPREGWAPVAGTRTFLGDYRKAWQRAAARACADARPTLLDDGNATLLVAARRRRPWWRLLDRGAAWAHGSTTRVPVPGILRDLRHPSAREHTHLEFFTIYRLDLRVADAQRRNDFQVLRSALPARLEDRPVFVGSSFVEQGWMHASAMDARLEDARDRFGPGVLYVAHRREADEKLERYHREFAVEVVRPSAPLELMLTDEAIRPAPLLGVLSSAFDSLRVVFPGLETRPSPPVAEEIPAPRRRAILRLAREVAGATLHGEVAPPVARP